MRENQHRDQCAEKLLDLAFLPKVCASNSYRTVVWIEIWIMLLTSIAMPFGLRSGLRLYFPLQCPPMSSNREYGPLFLVCCRVYGTHITCLLSLFFIKCITCDCEVDLTLFGLPSRPLCCFRPWACFGFLGSPCSPACFLFAPRCQAK